MTINQVNAPNFYLSPVRLCLFLAFFCLCLASRTEAQKQSSFLKKVTLVQDSLDVTRKSDLLYFSVRAFAPQGIRKITIELQSPSGMEKKQREFLIPGQPADKLLLGHFLFKKKSESGYWHINSIRIEDAKGRKETYSLEWMKHQHFKTTLFVKGRNSR